MDLTFYANSTKHRRRFFKSVTFCQHSKSCKLCCWEWKAHCNTRGYAIHNIYVHDRRKGVTISAARFIFTLRYGHTDLLVLHTCDNRLCVNFNHLYAGTQQDNMRDRKNRGRAPHGEVHHNSKLTSSAIHHMFTMQDQGYLAREIAEYFSISRSHASAILRREEWKHVYIPDKYTPGRQDQAV